MIRDTIMPPQPDQRRVSEMQKLNRVITDNSAQLSGFRLSPVGGVGYLLQADRPGTNEEETTRSPRKILMFDYDDTLVGTTAIKAKHQELYNGYLKKKDIDIDPQTSAELMQLTGAFCRWEVIPGVGPMYHPHAHASVLSWATEEMGTLIKSGSTAQQALADIESNLNRMKNVAQSEPNDPFSFTDDRRFITRNTPMWAQEIEDIFMKTMVDPGQFEEMIEAAELLSGDGFQLEVLTFGFPSYQLAKLANLMRAHPALNLARIHLCVVSKGTYMTELLEKEPELYENVSEITLIDDRPHELESFKGATNQAVKMNTVRIKKTGTKTYQIPDGTDNGPVIDLTHPKDPEEIANVIRNA